MDNLHHILRTLVQTALVAVFYYKYGIVSVKWHTNTQAYRFVPVHSAYITTRTHTINVHGVLADDILLFRTRTEYYLAT